MLESYIRYEKQTNVKIITVCFGNAMTDQGLNKALYTVIETETGRVHPCAAIITAGQQRGTEVSGYSCCLDTCVS